MKCNEIGFTIRILHIETHKRRKKMNNEKNVLTAPQFTPSHFCMLTMQLLDFGLGNGRLSEIGGKSGPSHG